MTLLPCRGRVGGEGLGIALKLNNWRMFKCCQGVPVHREGLRGCSYGKVTMGTKGQGFKDLMVGECGEAAVGL